jgi:hypothetical protein
MNKEILLQNISAYCGDDESMTNELMDLIKTAVSEAIIELKSLTITNDQQTIAGIAHKLRISIALIGEETLLNQAILLDESIVQHTELDLVESTFISFKSALNEIMKVINNLP